MPSILRIFSYQKVASLPLIGSFESCATVPRLRTWTSGTICRAVRSISFFEDIYYECIEPHRVWWAPRSRIDNKWAYNYLPSLTSPYHMTAWPVTRFRTITNGYHLLPKPWVDLAGGPTKLYQTLPQYQSGSTPSVRRLYRPGLRLW